MTLRRPRRLNKLNTIQIAPHEYVIVALYLCFETLLMSHNWLLYSIHVRLWHAWFRMETQIENGIEYITIAVHARTPTTDSWTHHMCLCIAPSPLGLQNFICNCWTAWISNDFLPWFHNATNVDTKSWNYNYLHEVQNIRLRREMRQNKVDNQMPLHRAAAATPADKSEEWQKPTEWVSERDAEEAIKLDGRGDGR